MKTEPTPTLAAVAPATTCSACGGCGMLPGTEPNDDVMNTPCPKCNAEARAAHDGAWERAFVVPIARTMKQRGIGYMVIATRDDGKAAYVLEPNTPDKETVDALIRQPNDPAQARRPADGDQTDG